MQLRAELPDLDTPDLKQAGGRGLRVAARLGYFTHGVVYGLVGTLALLSALGQRGGRVTNSQGAVQRIGDSDWGEPMLWAVAIGLACYALWNCVRAVFDPEHCGREGKGILKRLGYGVSATSHAFLSVYAFQSALGRAAAGGGSERSVAEVLGLPGGRILIGIAALAVIGFGLYQLYRGIAGEVGKEFSGSDLPATRRRLVMNVARLGFVARGVVFPIIGGSLAVVALGANPGETHNLGEALHEIAVQPFGSVLLGIVAAGLIAYGIHMLCVARYAKIPHPA